MGSNKSYQRKFSCHENVYCNCLGRGQNGAVVEWCFIFKPSSSFIRFWGSTNNKLWKKKCFVLKAAKIPSRGLGYEDILVFLSSVNLFSGNKNSKTHLIGANKIYQRHFDENVYSNCLGRAKNGSLGLGDVFHSNIGLFWSKTDKKQTFRKPCSVLLIFYVLYS